MRFQPAEEFLNFWLRRKNSNEKEPTNEEKRQVRFAPSWQKKDHSYSPSFPKTMIFPQNSLSSFDGQCPVDPPFPKSLLLQLAVDVSPKIGSRDDRIIIAAVFKMFCVDEINP